MNRREILGSLGTAAAGLAALSATSALADEKSDAKAHDHHKMMHEDCMKACAEGAKACDMAFHHCVMEVGKGNKEHAKSVQLLADCAGFCGLSACMMARHSPLMAYSCEACADACKATVAEVSKVDASGEAMMTAVRALKTCEESCRAMASCSCEECKAHHAAKTAAR